MRWCGWLVLVGLAAGCPRVARLRYHFDLRTLHGTLIAEGIGSDDQPNADFATLVNEYALGDRLQQDHPSWRVGARRLYENEGRLDGVVEFGFSDPLAAGLYQHDKKSAFLWCTPDSDDQIVATSGEVVGPYPFCAMFGRKSKAIDVTIGDDTEAVSLLPQWRAWDGGPIPVDPGASALGLSELLPDVAAPASWSALGLPLAGGRVVYANDQALQVSHDGDRTAVLARYADALTAAGFGKGGEDADASHWVRGPEAVSLSATQAGVSVIVSLAR
jgi:hypothetical protein